MPRGNFHNMHTDEKLSNGIVWSSFIGRMDWLIFYRALPCVNVQNSVVVRFPRRKISKISTTFSIVLMLFNFNAIFVG